MMKEVKEYKGNVNGINRLSRQSPGGASNRERAVVTGSVKGFDPGGDGTDADLVCLSHLRWDFVYQRPQHLLGRCARERRVFFVEEPLFGDELKLDVSLREEGVSVVVPHLPRWVQGEEGVEALQRTLLERLFADYGIDQHILWYYTPMALGWTRHLKPLAVVYDCMDELSAFKGAPPALRERERELFERADLVFTGGQSLYEAKRGLHPNVYAFPSSIERAHFAQARNVSAEEPADQRDIPHPRLGFFGVVDERFDIELLEGAADARPDWHYVVIGPVVKIEESALPRRQNIHYLGGKTYKELPSYLAGWDVALLLFARNEHTRFISPTKTPEYLAAGKPVVSTSIRDVVRPYGEMGFVQIADTVGEFTAAADRALNSGDDRAAWLERVDAFLANNSWDKTWARMSELIVNVAARAQAVRGAGRVAARAASAAAGSRAFSSAGD